MPDPKNPQALNRYSYVVNNPLRYADPTGSIFLPVLEYDPNSTFELYAYVSLCGYWGAAYEEIMGSAGVPSDIKNMMQTLHDSDRVIQVALGGTESFGLSAMDISILGSTARLNDSIQIGSSWIGNLAPMFVHECYHIYEGNPGASIEEEVQAYRYQATVATALGRTQTAADLDWMWRKPGAWGSDQYLGNVKAELAKQSDVYGVMPFRQSQMTDQRLAMQLLMAETGIRRGATFWSWTLSLVVSAEGVPIPRK